MTDLRDKPNMTRQEWYDFCMARGTSGDQVFSILEDWKRTDALYSKPISQDLLLTDEEILNSYASAPAPYFLQQIRDIAKAQLAKAEPLIRADERARTLKEVGDIMWTWQIQPTIFIRLPKDLRDYILDKQATKMASNGYEASFLD